MRCLIPHVLAEISHTPGPEYQTRNYLATPTAYFWRHAKQLSVAQSELVCLALIISQGTTWGTHSAVFLSQPTTQPIPVITASFVRLFSIVLPLHEAQVVHSTLHSQSQLTFF